MNKKMRIVDMHCDTILECLRSDEHSLRSGAGHLNLELMRDHGALCQFFALYLSRTEMRKMDPYSVYKRMLAVYNREIAANSDIIRPAYNADDIIKNAEDGYMSSFLTIEDGSFVSDRLERLEEVYNDGVRLITLLWGYPNTLGQPCYDDPKDNAVGLTRLGFEAVERMNDLGIIVDVSHISEGSFYDISKVSKKPFVATHSCAKALCGNKRNLTDDQLKVLAEKDGFVGINFYSDFLSDGPEDTSVELIMKHMDHMVNIAGIDHVGFGSDFDGIETTGELVNYGGYDKIIAAMSKKYSEDEIDKMLYKNALDLMRKTLK